MHRMRVLLCFANCILCGAAATAAVLTTDALLILNRSDFIGIEINLGTRFVKLDANDKTNYNHCTQRAMINPRDHSNRVRLLLFGSDFFHNFKLDHRSGGQ